MLNIVQSKDDLSSAYIRFHKLKGNMQNLYSVTVQANWRLTFEYDEKTNDIYILDYVDYH